MGISSFSSACACHSCDGAQQRQAVRATVVVTAKEHVCLLRASCALMIACKHVLAGVVLREEGVDRSSPPRFSAGNTRHQAVSLFHACATSTRIHCTPRSHVLRCFFQILQRALDFSHRVPQEPLVWTMSPVWMTNVLNVPQ